MAALHNNAPVETLLVLKDRDDSKVKDLLRVAKAKGIVIRFESRSTLDDYGRSHQGIVALLATDEAALPETTLTELIAGAKHKLILVLDGVTDPHNLGACVRSAEALGADGVVIPKDKSASVTPVVHKTSAGASQIIPIVSVTNLADALKQLQAAGFWIVGLAGEADTLIQEIDFSTPTALVLGSEGGGLRRLTKEHCDFLAKIQLAGQTESLNVSVASGIALFEVARQRAV